MQAVLPAHHNTSKDISAIELIQQRATYFFFFNAGLTIHLLALPPCFWNLTGNHKKNPTLSIIWQSFFFFWINSSLTNVFFPPEMVLGLMDTRQSHDFKSTLFLVLVNTYLFCPKISYYRTNFPYWQYTPSVFQLKLLVCSVILIVYPCIQWLLIIHCL